ncbi:MAG TPA: nuclear transport factor 2 family protein [Acidimicrobiales bacterium]
MDDITLDAVDAATLREAVNYIAIRRLQQAYADTVTRRAWPELRELFRSDAEVVIDKRDGSPIVLVGPDAVGEFIGAAIAQFEFFEFVILNTRIDIDGDRASARLWMQELRQDHSGRWTNAYGLYVDQHERVDGRWWFAGRHYRSLARTARDNDVFGIPEL